MAEEKVRFQMRISPRTDQKVKAAMPLANCKSQNEFVEEALNFYCDYLSTKNFNSAIPTIYLQALQATIECSENRISRLLFKLAVEQDMMMNVLAAGLEINTEELDALRGRCVRDVKRTSGAISFKDVVKYQNHED